MSNRPCECDDGKEKEETSIELPIICECPRDDHGLIVHIDTCVFYNKGVYVYQNDKMDMESEDEPLPELCGCGQPFELCKCFQETCKVSNDELTTRCICCQYASSDCVCQPDIKRERVVKDRWETAQENPEEEMNLPEFLEPSHPLMQKFQETLQRYLERELKLAEAEIVELRDDLKEKRDRYEKELESIYKQDQDTNKQRKLVEEYEEDIEKMAKEKTEQENQVNEMREKYKNLMKDLNQEMINEREAMQERQALTTLVAQYEEWQKETESELNVKQRMSEKMKIEKKELRDKKRKLDMIIYRLNNAVWNYESEIELFKKQLAIKNEELEQVRDKNAEYMAEFEDLEQEHKRLLNVWNSVLVNISQRDKIFSSIKDDCAELFENHRTLIANLDALKKTEAENMKQSQGCAMQKDKIRYDLEIAQKIHDAEEVKRINFETKIEEMYDAINMTQKDLELLKLELEGIRKNIKNVTREYEKRVEEKLVLESKILESIKDRVLTDKAAQVTAAEIVKLREKNRKIELKLMIAEDQQAKLLLEIEILKARQTKNQQLERDYEDKINAKEKEVAEVEAKITKVKLQINQKQRELDAINKKRVILLDKNDNKSPEEREMMEAERTIYKLKEKLTALQEDWLRVQSHVVRMTKQNQSLLQENAIHEKQIEICEEKEMRMKVEEERVRGELEIVIRSIDKMRKQLEVMQKHKKDQMEKNSMTMKANSVMNLELTARLKDAEMDIMKLEEDINNYENEKSNLNAQLNKVQKEALVWQRKALQAAELRKKLQESKSEEGDIFKMKSEIHKMTIRLDQLKRIGEKLSIDMANMVTRREVVMEKTRATLALNKGNGLAVKQYETKLRLAKADVSKMSKEVELHQKEYEDLTKEYERFMKEIEKMKSEIRKTEDDIERLKKRGDDATIEKQYVLERCVRQQKLGMELKKTIKNKEFRLRQSESSIRQEYEKNVTELLKLKDIVETLMKDRPELEYKLKFIRNTLIVESPNLSPRDCGTDKHKIGDDCIICKCKEEVVMKHFKIYCPE